MGATPKFSPGQMDFGSIAPTRQITLTVSCPALTEAATITAGIRISSPTNGFVICPFSVVSVAPPVTPTRGPVLGGISGGAAAAVSVAGSPKLSPQVRTVAAPGIAGIASGAGQEFSGVTGTINSGLGVGVDVLCVAPANNSGSTLTFNATLEITSPAWDNPVSIPLTVQVTTSQTLNITVPPVSVIQDKSTTVEITISAVGGSTTATVSPPDSGDLPAGVTVAFAPTSFSIAPGTPQKVQLTVTAALTAPPSVNPLILYWTAFNGMVSANVNITVGAIKLRPSPICAKYAAMSLKMNLGASLGDEAFCTDYVGQYHAYQNGAIYWSGSGDNAYFIDGTVLTRYLRTGNPEVGAPPGFPSAAPTLADYAAAPGCGLGYPTQDVFTNNTGHPECKFQNDNAIYGTDFGPLIVDTEAFYLQKGGSTGPLGLPVNEGLAGSAGLPKTPSYFEFGYQDFENGGIFVIYADKGSIPQAIMFGAPGNRTGTQPIPSLPGLGDLTGNYYLQPQPSNFSTEAPAAVIFAPLWVLFTITAEQFTKIIQQLITEKIDQYNKTAKHQVNIVTNAALANPPVTNFTEISPYVPNRLYRYTLTLHTEAVDSLVASNIDVTFDIVFSLDGNPGAIGQSVIIAPVNPSVSWDKTSVVNIPPSDRTSGTEQLEGLLTASVLSIPLPPQKTGVKSGPITADVALAWIALNVLSHGTLCLLASTIDNPKK